MEAAFEGFGREFAERVDRLDDRLLRGERTRAVLGWLGFASVGVLLALFAFGMLMLATLFAFLVVPVVIVVGAALPILVCKVGGKRTWAHIAAIVLPAIIVPVAGLLGFNVLWGAAHLERPKPLPGLVVASVVVGGLEYLYLRWVHRDPPDRPQAWAGWGALSGLALYVATRRIQWPEVEILVDAALLFAAVWAYLHHVTGPDVKRPFWWASLLVLGFVFTVPLASEAVQRARPGIGTLVVLLVAGGMLVVYARRVGRENREEQRVVRRHLWPVLLLAAGIVAAAVIAKATGVKAEAPVGKPLPVAVAGGPLTADDPAVRHRPILMFDSGEVLRTPVDIDSLFRSGFVEHCPEGKGLLADCPALGSVDDLTNDGGNLRFKTESFDNDSFASRIYVNVKTHGDNTYLDYWWYLPDNPANTARGAMCGAGLVIPEITCFDHQSDWEGVTVVLDKAKQPVAVNYAAHRFVVSVPWPVAHAAALRAAPGLGVAASDLEARPIVFVARGTHAAYPQPCHNEFCRTNSFANDNQFDGRNAWPENGCPTCVSAFPTTGGTDPKPASWNAFTGHWGSALCLTEDLYCARSEAPKAPGAQNGRFARPWCVTHEVRNGDLRHPAALSKRERTACATSR